MSAKLTYKEFNQKFENAKTLEESGDLQKAEKEYVLLLNSDGGSDEECIKVQELAMDKLSDLYEKHEKVEQMKNLILNSRNFLTTVTKAKTSKIVRRLIEKFQKIPDCLPTQIDVTKQMIEWCIEGKRTFLRQNLETKLIALYHDNQNFTEALKLIGTLLKELKRLDDKMVLIEVQLLESKVCHSLRNFPKARAALTSARTSANAIYCPPLLQASLDMQSGILHAEEKDYKTAFSYFFETYESYSSTNDKKSILALKYMLLCKIMLGLTDDINSIISGKIGLSHLGKEIDAMKAVSQAHKNRSLQEFESALNTYREELGNDQIIRTHLAALYDTLLEQNLQRVIEPYSHVEISKVAKLVNLPSDQVETKLSQMILDHSLNGILDQGKGCLIIFEEKTIDESYELSLNTLKNMGQVVESLYQKAAQLN